MPQALPILVAALGPGGPLTIPLLTAGQAFVATVAASYISTAYMKRKAEARARRAWNAAQRDRIDGTSTTDKARSVVYGRVRVADGILFKASHGEHKKFYTLVIGLGLGEIDGVEDVYLGDIKVELDADGYVLTDPYQRTDKTTSYGSLVLDANGSGTFDLPAQYVTDSASAVLVTDSNDGGRPPTQTPVPFTVVNNVLTVTTFAEGASQAISIIYQTLVGTPYARVRAFTGAAGQNISPLLHELVPELVSAGDSRFAGIPCLLVTYEYSTDAFPNGAPIPSAVVRGRRLWDPRTGLTTWYAPDSPNTDPHPGENLALQALDWVLHPNGGGLTLEDVVLESFIEAANDCDVATQFNTLRVDELYDSPTPAAEAVTEPRYIGGLVCPTDVQPDELFAEMVSAMAGKWGWEGGKLAVRAGAYHLPVLTVTEDMVSDAGSIDILPSDSPHDAFNIITPSIIDAANDYVQVPLPEVSSVGYIAADGQELPVDVLFESITKAHHAVDVCEVMMLEARQDLSISLPVKLHGLVLTLFDVVTLQLPHYGINGTFEVLGWSFELFAGVRLFLREITASTYDPATRLTINGAANNTSLPNPFQVLTPEGLVVSSVAQLDTDNQLVTRTLVLWEPYTEAQVLQSGTIEVQWAGLGIAPSLTGWTNEDGDLLPWSNLYSTLLAWIQERTAELADSDWSSRAVAGDTTFTEIVGLRAGWVYVFRIRAVSTLGVRSSWSTQVALAIPSVPTNDATAVAEAVAAAEAAANSAAAAASAASAAASAVAGAIQAAEDAAAEAQAAALLITNLSSDNVLSAVEKPQVAQQYTVITAEDDGIEDQASDYGITTELTNYLNSITNLTNYLNTLQTPTPWNDLSGETDVVGATFRAAFVSVYTARQVVLNRIAEEAGKRAVWSSVSGIPYEAIYANDDAVALGLNPTFSAWTGAYPDGWVVWSGAAPTKESVLTRIGLYSVRYVASAGALGMYAERLWTATPMALGTFVAGTVDMQIVSRVSGAPGLIVELVTNAGNTTHADTLVVPPSLGVGAWQRVHFTARTQPGERIYGIRILLLASYAGLSGGVFTGTVVYDNLRLAFFDQSVDNSKITINADGTLGGAGSGQVTITGLGYTGALDATADVKLANIANCTISGNRITKTSGGSAWNGNAFAAQAAYVGPCVVSFVVDNAAGTWVMGALTTDPAYVGYAHLDFAIYAANGSLERYENGSGLPIGTVASGDQLAVEYDGIRVHYKKNGLTQASTFVGQIASPLVAAFALNVVGNTVSAVRFHSTNSAAVAGTNLYDSTGRLTPDNRLLGNLIDCTSWYPGRSMPPPGGWALNGDQNAIELLTAPDGVLRPVWRATSDGGSDASGGWDLNGIPIDATKAYRFSVWAKSEDSGAGQIYHGVGYSTVQDMQGNTNGNPYFVVRAKASMVVGRWYLFVGYVFPTGTPNAQGNNGGIWDGVSGQKVVSGADYRWAPGITSSAQRVYQFYATTPNARAQFWAPRVDMLDGNEPQVKDLLNVTGTDLIAPYAATEILVSSGTGPYDIFSMPDIAVTLPTGLPSTAELRISFTVTLIGYNSSPSQRAVFSCSPKLYAGFSPLAGFSTYGNIDDVAPLVTQEKDIEIQGSVSAAGISIISFDWERPLGGPTERQTSGGMKALQYPQFYMPKLVVEVIKK